MNMNFLQAPPGQANFGIDEKKWYRFFLIATLRQCLFTAEVPQLWSDVSSRPEKPKKKVGWAQFGSRPTGEHWPAVQAYGVWH